MAIGKVISCPWIFCASSVADALWWLLARDTEIVTLWSTPTCLPVSSTPVPHLHLPIFFPSRLLTSSAISHHPCIVPILTSGPFSVHTKEMISCAIHNTACLLEGFHPAFVKAAPQGAIVPLPSCAAGTGLGSWPTCNPSSGFFFLLQLMRQESL